MPSDHKNSIPCYQVVLQGGRLGSVSVACIFRHGARFLVPQLCPGVEDNSVSSFSAAQRKVRIFRINEKALLEPAQLLQQIRSNEEATTRRKAGLSHGIKLSMICLTVSDMFAGTRPQIYSAASEPDEVRRIHEI